MAAPQAAAALNPQANARIQMQTEFHKGALKIPHFYGEPVNDTLTVNDFFANFEGALKSANLDEDGPGKIAKIFPYLENTAKSTYEECWEWELVPAGDYEAFKNLFLEKFKGKLQAHNTAATFEKLKQKPGESVMTFSQRIRKETKPWAHSVTVADDSMPENFVALAAADKAACRKAFQIAVHQQIARTLFLSGVKDSIKTLLQRKGPTTIQEAVTEAIKLEETEVGKSGSRIHDLADMDDSELNELKVEELTEEDLSLIHI